MDQAYNLIMTRQLGWVAQHGVPVDSQGYVLSVQDNLYSMLSEATRSDFQASAGKELVDAPGKRAKMRAVHSSSVLVCNLLDLWRTADPGAIARALGITVGTPAVRFEAKLPSGLRGTPPTLDVLLSAAGSRLVGVESRFTEPFRGERRPALFARSYFRDRAGIWTQRGLPRCQSLAQRMNEDAVHFRRLDAGQLLKHALGLRRARQDATLMLVWYNVDAPEARVLAEEIHRFADLIDPGLGFRALTHQEVFQRLSAEPAAPPG